LSRGISNRLQITLECLGAAAAISAPSVPAWDIGYTDGNVCGSHCTWHLNDSAKDNGAIHRGATQALRYSFRFPWYQSTDLSLIGMTTGCFASTLCVEHLYFRKGIFAFYDVQSWNVHSQRPLGAAALGACALSFLFVIPSMPQMWYTGPIARKTGDIGFEVAMAATALLHTPLRQLEKHWRGV